MLKLFRKFKWQWVKSKSISRYLLYAMGEIILVVIGILIALQINNWNEARKEELAEKEILANLHGEFKDNLIDLDSISFLVDQVIFSLETVFDRFIDRPSNRNQDSIDHWLSRALMSPNWMPSEYLLNTLNNSGTIVELKNKRLKRLLYKWSRLRKEMLEVQVRSEKTGEEIITYLKENGSLRNVDVANNTFNYRPSSLFKNNQILLSDYRFENQIDDKLFMYKMTQLILKQARSTLLELIEETEV